MNAKSKVKNATAVDAYGIHFRSKLELYTYEAFMKAGIPVKYEPKHFTLLPKFEFMGEKIRPITYLPDFKYRVHTHSGGSQGNLLCIISLIKQLAETGEKPKGGKSLRLFIVSKTASCNGNLGIGDFPFGYGELKLNMCVNIPKGREFTVNGWQEEADMINILACS